MAEQAADTGEQASGGRSGRARTVVALILAVVLTLVFALLFVGAFRHPKPHQLPFGVTGSSQLTMEVERHISLNTIHYSSETEARKAIDHRKVYGALIVSPETSTLLTAPAAGKSIATLLEVEFFLAERQVALSKKKTESSKINEARQGIATAQEEAANGTLSPFSIQQEQQSLQAEGQSAVSKAKNAPPPLKLTQVHGLPKEDPNGAVALLVAIGLVFGAYITATLLFKASGVATKRGRSASLVGWAIALGLLVDVLVGPILGGVGGEHFLILWPIFAGIALAVVLATAGLQTILGALGTLIAVVVLIVIGISASGESLAPSFLPGFWSAVGPYLPQYNAHTLIQNTLYFDGNGITHSLIVLGAYAVLGAMVMVTGWVLVARSKGSGEDTAAAAGSPSAATSADGPSPRARVIVTLVLVIVLPLFYIFSYVGANRDPKPHQLPFGVTGSSQLTTETEKQISLDVKDYPSGAAARSAIDHREIYGALIVKPKTSTLLTAPAASPGIAGLLEDKFLGAAQQIASNKVSAARKKLKTGGAQQDLAKQRLEKAQNAPPPVKTERVHTLPNEDPVGVVSLLTALSAVIGGYVAATILMKATGVTAKRWRVALLLGWAVLTGLLVDVLVGPILGGVEGGDFLALWPVLAGIAFAVALATAGLQTILGSLGTLVVMATVVIIGIPASGGTLAPSFLPGFWRAVGPYLPPYNGASLVQNTLYFDGNGITHSLIVLGAYAVLGAIVIIVGWTSAARSPVDGETEAGAAAGATAAG